MKTVFTDLSTIAHLWANQNQQSARNSGNNFFFERDTIYSYGYHFPIAKHVVNDNGDKAVLFTERTYSVTTAKHIRIVHHAANHLNVILCYNPEKSSHDDNFNSWLINVERIANNLVKAKKPEIYLNQIPNIADKVNKYALFFGLTIPVKLQAALSIGNKDQYKEYADKKAALELADKKRQQKELEKKHKKELSDWLNFETNRLYTRNGYDFLRVNNDLIETTQAVKIPIETGKMLWKAIKDNSLTIGTKVIDHNNSTFFVNEIGKEIVVGCHTFKTDYLLKFGEKIFK